MKDSKIKKLFETVGKEKAPEVPFNFSQNVLSAMRRDARQPGALSIFDELGRLFPRLAFACVVVIGLCVAADVYFTQKESTLTDNVEQVANEWLFAAK